MPRAEIADNGYDLSISRYKEIVTGLDELEAMLQQDEGRGGI